jgi:ubiquinone/menaquinone biosynthesis C-methylase UbiE
MTMGTRLDPECTETRTVHGLVDFRSKDVLEVGCGDGRLTWRFAHEAASVLAIDPDEASISTAREQTPDVLKSKVTFRVGDIGVMKPAEDAFDLAVLSWSL